jgi:hypothetical protein
MVNGDYIEFKNEGISDIATVTRNSQSQWDDVWNGVKSELQRLVGDALDTTTGGSLEARSAEYHQKSTAYTSDVNLQHLAMTNIGNISVDTNNSMARTIRG